MNAPVFIIFGITGDLSKRKLLPALYHLFSEQVIPEDTKIIGVSRRDVDEDKLLDSVELCVLEKNNVCNPDGIARLKNALEMMTIDVSDPGDYRKLADALDVMDEEQKRDRLFYMSIPPSAYKGIVQNLGDAGLNDDRSRLLIEKPFGHDVESAKELSEFIAQHFDESQIFRIDHYLAKETAQNLLAFRMKNPIFAKLWNDRSIERIEVRALEKIGVENRIDFYEGTGALRDVLQGHLLQLLAITMMNIDGDEQSIDMAARKSELLASIAPARHDEAMRAQYRGYKEEVENPDTSTETFARVRLHSEMEGWQNTDIIVETGKATGIKSNEIIVTFVGTAHSRNRLKFQLQPDEGISLGIVMKRPGFDWDTEEHVLDVSYDDVFKDAQQPEAYERVLVDAMKGDRSLFAGIEEIMESWRIVQPLLETWLSNGDGLVGYEQGTIPNA